MSVRTVVARLVARKAVRAPTVGGGEPALRRVLGPMHLFFIGVGSVIGAGIYVMTGAAAAEFAGPAVALSFLIATLACCLTALCYAELASIMPSAGSAYSYAYATLGELVAWIVGWLLVLEYGVAASTVAVGFSGYSVSLLTDLGLSLPTALTSSAIGGIPGQPFFFTGGIDLFAAGAVFAVTALLIVGVSEMARVANVMVVAKILVLILFVCLGRSAIDMTNLTPFIPANEGGYRYGWEGVLRAAPVVFFAYVGFDTVSTAAIEARNPDRDVPRAIIATLLACTALYVSVATVLTGVVPFRSLNVADPLAVAVAAIDVPGFGLILKLSAVIGLFSVLLITIYGQSRIFLVMARDGLLPARFATIHKRKAVPVAGTIMTGFGVATLAALLPISLLADLVSLGTAVAFIVVCICVMRSRAQHPGIERTFRVPLGGLTAFGLWWGVVPVLGVLACTLMILPLILDVGGHAMAGNMLPAIIIMSYILLGAALYLFYGYRHSLLAKVSHNALDQIEPLK